MSTSPAKTRASPALLVVAIEGRNFVSLGLRPDALRTMRYYCQIVIEDVKTSDILLNVRTNRVQRGQTNVVWNEELYFEFPPGRKKKDVELKVMCFEHSPLHDHFQGEVVLPLGHLHRHRALDQWYALARRDKKPVRGEVHLKLELGVDVPENYVRRPSSLDGSDPTVRASMPVGLDMASFRSADDKRALALSSPDKKFKKSFKGFRDKFKKTTQGVRGYFSEADDGSDGQASPLVGMAGGAVTEDEAGRLRDMRENVDLDHLLHHRAGERSNSVSSDGFVDDEESVGDSDHSEGGGGSKIIKRKSGKSSKRTKKRKEGSILVLNSNEGHLINFDDLEDGGSGINGWRSDGSAPSSPRYAVTTDESGEVLGVITPTTLIEHFEDEEEEVCSEGDVSMSASADVYEGADGSSSLGDLVSSQQAFSTARGDNIKKTKKTTNKKKNRLREPLAVIIEESGGSATSSDQEDGGFGSGGPTPSPFKKTIKRGGLVASDETGSPATIAGPSQGRRPRSASDFVIPRLKLSDGIGGYDSSAGSKGSRRRQKKLYASSQRLALLNRFPTYDSKSKATIISQRQRAYHIWLDSYHRDMDDFFDDTRDWKAPIGMQDSDKLDYVALAQEWKRPWQKDMEQARETKDNLQEVINDEMEDMEGIIRKINDKAGSHFEQTTLYSQSAVSAMRDIAKETRKRQLQEQAKQKKEEKMKKKRDAAASSTSPSSSPSSSRRIGPLMPTPSSPPESTGYRPVIVFLATLLILYILNTFM